MVNPHYRDGQSISQRCRYGCANQESSSEPRPLCVSDAAKVAHAIPILIEQRFDHWKQVANMIARSQFRDHTAIFRVQCNLGMNAMSEQPCGNIVQRHTGFVAGGLDSEYKHFSGSGGAVVWQNCLEWHFQFANQMIIVRMRAFRKSSARVREVFNSMPTIRVKENEPFEVALRRFKRTVEKTGLLTELRAREYYEKPTTARKRKLAAAVKRHHKRLRGQILPPRMY